MTMTAAAAPVPTTLPVVSAPTPDNKEIAGRRTVTRAMKIGLWVWPSYTLLDVYMCFVAYPGAPFPLFLLYRLIVEIGFVGVYRATLKGTVKLERLFWLQNGAFVAAAVGIALMAVHLGGIRSAYMHGISIVALVRTALVPSSWRKGLNTYAGIALAFPVVMAVAALASPASRSEWLNAPSLIFFSTHYIFVLTTALLGLMTGHMVWSAQEQLYRARRVGRYRLQAPLGQGGMGEVWLAWDQSLNRNIALKILRVGTASNPAAIRRFELEAQAAGRLRGPHVAHVFDFGASDDGLYYIAMEYLVGMNLATLIEKFGPLPPGRAIHLAIQACVALEEAHASGIIHRDLKPHNLYVTHVPDDPDFIKLLDFGVARLRAAGAADERLTKVGLVVGTPAYVAPELWHGGEADERSDIFAFGITLHVMLTGVTPFEGWSLSQIQAAHITGKLPPLRLEQDGPLGERLEKLLLRCIAWSESDRLQSVRELRQQLVELQASARWTRDDADAFWKSADRVRFS